MRLTRVQLLLSGATPRPRSGLGFWRTALQLTAVLVAPTAPCAEWAACRALGRAPAISGATWGIALATLVVGTAAAQSGPLLDALRRARGRRRAAQRGGEPWWRDRAWEPMSTTQNLASRNPIANWLIGFMAIVSPWLFLLFADWNPSTPPKPIRTLPSVVPPLIAVLVFAEVAVLRRRKRRRAVVVSWPELPQRTGGPATFHVGVPEPNGPRIVELRIVLRCIREERTGFLGLSRRAVSVWRAEFPVAPDLYIGPGAEIRATFDLRAAADTPGAFDVREAGAPAADPPPTNLYGPDVVFWELVILGRTPLGPTKRALVIEPVLVPVY